MKTDGWQSTKNTKSESKKELKNWISFYKGLLLFCRGVVAYSLLASQKESTKKSKSSEIEKYEKSFLFIKQFVWAAMELLL